MVGSWWFANLVATNHPTTNRSTIGQLRHLSCCRRRMRFVRLYLIGYFILLLGAGVALWRSGVLDQVPRVWAVIAAVVAIGLGAMLAIVSRASAVKTHE